MTISEQQLETWSHVGSQTQSASTYQAIKEVLEHPDAPFSDRGFEIYLQGSYGNTTNVRGSESDVDIVICLTEVYIADTSSLDATEKATYEASTSSADYSFHDFKRDVLLWLKTKFGTNVTSGRKAISIPSNGTRRDADVLVCIRHRRFSTYLSPSNNTNSIGITFYTSDGDQIINFPKQHKSNCTEKHQTTNNRFKLNVRVLKNMRNAMINDGFLTDNVAPSYFLEGLVWNVPNNQFVASFQQSFENHLYWLERCNSNDLTCANKLYYLIREDSRVCWNPANYSTFLTALRSYWNSGVR